MGLLRLRLEIFNDTDGSNEAVGIDSLLISGTVAQLATAINPPCQRRAGDHQLHDRRHGRGR